MLAATEIDFKQVALNTYSEFDALRESGQLLFRQLPLLELDGLFLVQSQAIVRYVVSI